MKIRLKFLSVAVISLLLISLSAFNKPEENTWNDETPIYSILGAFGEKLPAHAKNTASEEQIKQGRDLVFEGRTIGPDGKTSKYISKFYVCTSCHSPVQEDPDLRYFDPETRLDYAAKNNLKFLQGSTFYGIANRESWYNDDYILKYGDLVKPASKSLAEATQLCAKVCSSGRYLEDWELEAILAYYWSTQLKLGDLSLTEKEKQSILKAPAKENTELIKLIKSKYAQKSPATFGHTPKDPTKGYSSEGRPEKGKLIYELSCLSCHIENGVAGMNFATAKVDFQKFKRNLDKKTDYNIYEISRHGTYTGDGKPRYMPLYTEERMSDRQLEDLRAYILQEAK